MFNKKVRSTPLLPLLPLLPNYPSACFWRGAADALLLLLLLLTPLPQIARYYDKYTAEIRASFERGTAL